jgi:hypothetical protein
MTRVLIATPTYSGQVYAAFSHSLTQTLRLNGEGGLGFDIRDYYPRGQLIEHARNDCIAEALRHGFDELVWVDSDQDWQAPHLFDLLSYPVNFVAAPVRKKSDTPERYNVRNREGPASFYVWPETGLWGAKDLAVGCGFTRVSRLALEALARNAATYRHGGSEYPWVFEVKPVEGELQSEDFMVSDKLRGLGHGPWLAPDIDSIGHHDGMKRYSGNFRGWLKGLQS